MKRDELKDTIKSIKNAIESEHLAGVNEIFALDLGKEDVTLTGLADEVSPCVRCSLSKTRKNVVFGAGSPNAKLMFIGEAPGAEEDNQGRPFVGRAGQLLTKIIESIGLKREDVYIANILKCRPPGNRNPLPGEIATCSPYLIRQIELIKPKVICALGKFAAQTLLNSEMTIGKLRGTFYYYRGIKLMPTYHPAYLLRNSSGKKEVWIDMQAIARELGLKVPKGKNAK